MIRVREYSMSYESALTPVRWMKVFFMDQRTPYIHQMDEGILYGSEKPNLLGWYSGSLASYSECGGPETEVLEKPRRHELLQLVHSLEDFLQREDINKLI